MSAQRVLLIGNDPLTHPIIAEMIRCEDLALIAASNAREGLEKATGTFPQLVLVDMHSAATANLDLCRALRSLPEQMPIIVLSSIQDDIDKVLLLETGADDYVVKPFNSRELLARMRGLLRRGRYSAQIHHFSDVGVNLTHRVVNKGGEEVKLTRAEYNLLAFFLQHPGRVVTRDIILNCVWGYDAYPNTRTVDVHVMKLRQKLENDEGSSRHFRTVHGVGYRFVPHG